MFRRRLNMLLRNATMYKKNSSGKLYRSYCIDGFPFEKECAHQNELPIIRFVEPGTSGPQKSYNIIGAAVGAFVGHLFINVAQCGAELYIVSILIAFGCIIPVAATIWLVNRK